MDYCMNISIFVLLFVNEIVLEKLSNKDQIMWNGWDLLSENRKIQLYILNDISRLIFKITIFELYLFSSVMKGWITAFNFTNNTNSQEKTDETLSN